MINARVFLQVKLPGTIFQGQAGTALSEYINSFCLMGVDMLIRFIFIIPVFLGMNSGARHEVIIW